MYRARPALPPILVTWTLIAACAAVFVIELAKGAGFATMPIDVAIRLGANYGPLTLTGQWWRLLTSMFLHFGILHIALNMWCLLQLGLLAERMMGRAAFTLLYFATGLAGSLASVAVHPQEVAAGASGAIFGVAGGLVAYLMMKKTPLDYGLVKRQLRSLAIFLGINLIYSVAPGIDLMAHAGGVASGFAIGAALPPFLRLPGAITMPAPFQTENPAKKRIVTIAFSSAALLLVAALGVYKLQGNTALVLHALDQMDQGGIPATMVPKLERVVQQNPDMAIAHFALGWAYFQNGRAAAGIADLEKAVQLDPGEPVFRTQLIAAYEQTGQTAKADALKTQTNVPANGTKATPAGQKPNTH
jgi:membrane associated rhomboid family serine protease